MWPPYAFSLLVVYFLQQLRNPVLPVLHELQTTAGSDMNPDVYLGELRMYSSCFHKSVFFFP
jgi:hypothetical protein